MILREKKLNDFYAQDQSELFGFVQLHNSADNTN